jgi:nucleotide-binding universal stress UspA family protein
VVADLTSINACYVIWLVRKPSIAELTSATGSVAVRGQLICWKVSRAGPFGLRPESSEKAIRHGVELSKLAGAKVTGVTVTNAFRGFSGVQVPRIDRTDPIVHLEDGSVAAIPKLPGATRFDEQFDTLERIRQKRSNIVRTILDTIEAAARASNVPCETVEVQDEHPYQGIIHTPREKGCDLIVMASHGRRGISALLIGSETHKVVTHTNIPVLICR